MMTWRPNDHWIICDISGQKILRSQARYTWDGLLVNKKHWYPKQPQLNVKGRDEKIAVADTRPRQPDKFYTPGPEDL